MIRRLIEGGEVKEYSGHLIPEGGWNSVPPLSAATAGASRGMPRSWSILCTGKGSNLAMTSGTYAAEAVIEAKKRGDFSRETLSLYDEKIRQSFIRKDLVKYKGMHEFLKEEDPDLLFNRLPQAANQALYELFLVDGVPKGEKQKKMFRTI